MIFTNIVRKIDELDVFSDEIIKLADRHILLNEHEAWFKLKPEERNL